MALDFDSFLAAPRLSGLALSPGGDRLVTSVATLAPDGKSFRTALWAVDPVGDRAPVRLTRSAAGEGAPAFTADGDLLFVSKRADADAEEGKADDAPALWLLPAAGEGRRVAGAPAGIEALATARACPAAVVRASVFPGATIDEDGERGKARKDAGVSAVLFDDYPIRFWDHELGPREGRLFLATPGDGDEGDWALRDLTPEPGRALDDTQFDVSPDGRTVVTGWITGETLHARSPALVAIDLASGERRVLADGDGVFHAGPAISPDSQRVVCVQVHTHGPDRADTVTLLLVDLATGEARDLTPDLDLWPDEPVWAPDGTAVYFCADEQGRRPVFRVDVESGAIRRISRDGAFHGLQVSPDGSMVFAVRDSWVRPPHVVRLDGSATDGEPTVLWAPADGLAGSSRLEEVVATAADGTPVHSWLVLPSGASAEHPAPLAVWIHGGPLSSWNSWSWRWCPHLLVERGYAVLLPDPALSTGYGQAFIDRGWGRWGAEPFTDLMAAVDAAVARPDIDESRTAAMGGSFGGYLTNWVAGHTDRFRCLVTHASLWALDQFHGTTDNAIYWEFVFGDPYQDASRYHDNSPHLHVDKIHTPMLVIHGENDDRVPIGEGLRLYTDLRRHGVESQFLLFPDEHHWVLKPNNSRVWYHTVLSWLDHHVSDKELDRSPLL